MPMRLRDHHQRLRDLETAFGALRRLVLRSRPEAAADLADVARKLRSAGDKGAADLLFGEPAHTAYRR